jgi:hypothetical protein
LLPNAQDKGVEELRASVKQSLIEENKELFKQQERERLEAMGIVKNDDTREVNTTLEDNHSS